MRQHFPVLPLDEDSVLMDSSLFTTEEILFGVCGGSGPLGGTGSSGFYYCKRGEGGTRVQRLLCGSAPPRAAFTITQKAGFSTWVLQMLYPPPVSVPHIPPRVRPLFRSDFLLSQQRLRRFKGGAVDVQSGGASLPEVHLQKLQTL
ncbi:hypothetical protein FQA47_013874 [Oryzias melastigma]|uniref:Uncharacterized protein n=1 Tax=Oryzias melastigma TaxID=30732 RepID=A0A834BXQ6_ORYME|nr:hypothetical protein FQA47_013874 [Oryzias melastigma]